MVELFLIEDMNSKDLVCQHCKAVAFRIIATDRESLKFSLGDLIVALNHKCFDELNIVKLPRHINWKDILEKIVVIEGWIGIGAGIVTIVWSVITKDYPLGYLGSFFIAVCIWLLLFFYPKGENVGK